MDMDGYGRIWMDMDRWMTDSLGSPQLLTRAPTYISTRLSRPSSLPGGGHRARRPSVGSAGVGREKKKGRSRQRRDTHFSSSPSTPPRLCMEAARLRAVEPLSRRRRCVRCGEKDDHGHGHDYGARSGCSPRRNTARMPCATLGRTQCHLSLVRSSAAALAVYSAALPRRRRTAGRTDGRSSGTAERMCRTLAAPVRGGVRSAVPAPCSSPSRSPRAPRPRRRIAHCSPPPPPPPPRMNSQDFGRNIICGFLCINW